MARWFVDRSHQQGIPFVSLRRLLPDAQFLGCPDWEISGCTSDARRLEPGQVFVAIREGDQDGHDQIGLAIERGAAGVIVERPCPEAGRLQVVVSDTKAALATLCQALAGDPSGHLRLVGVTGVAGTTTVSLFLRSIFEAAAVRQGWIGLLDWSDGSRRRPLGGRGASCAEGFAQMLAAMVEHGCEGGVVEVPLEALERRVLHGIRFDAALVTDLGGPVAPDREAALYRRRALAARLFRLIAPGGLAVVNADDPLSEVLGAVNLDAHRVAFALHAPADVTAAIEELGPAGTRFRLLGFEREAPVQLALIGSRNVLHALAAAAVARLRGVPLEAVVRGLEAVVMVPGQLVPVREGQPFEVRVDRARTPEELRHALGALREICPGRLHCVLGAEGHGDPADRRALAQAAEASAERLILTSDNPRGEDPAAILHDLLAGLERPNQAHVEADRQRALEAALAAAQPGDGVLIAGKGDETFQILADRAHAFDDHARAAAWLRERFGARRRASA
jgi:UDP-N-acetylmuramoyl-L-alanyl-D-glutamate--2,6-diaminopimelate ligase